MRRLLGLAGALLCILCSLISFYLAITNPDMAGGRGGLIVVGAIFLFFAVRLAKADRR
jgi:hypothetical protein